MPSVLCCLPTRGRYHTTLPLVVQAIANQTRRVDRLVIFDDNDEPQDLRKEFLYQHLFWVLDKKGIPWEVQFAEKKGQHHIHQRANLMGLDWVWRCDDDAVPEPNVLESLLKHATKGVGAVGGSVFNPPTVGGSEGSTGKIERILEEPNLQWSPISEVRQVEHLYSTFLYRAGVHDYNLGLSRVAHREETLFTWGLHQRGYKVLAVPDAVTWHLKSPTGGIRDGSRREMFDHDERIFRNFLERKDKTIVVLNCGMGDHIVFSHVLPDIKNAEVYSCYPSIVPGDSIARAQELFGDLSPFNVYGKMDQWRWKGTLEQAYRRLYRC